MGGLFKYSGLITKIRAMQSYMLTHKNYDDMVHMSSVKEIALYLKDCKSYSNALSDINENDIHRGQIEKKLMYSMYKDYEKIYKFTNGNDRSFLDAYFIYFEVEILKTLLRMVFDSRQIEYDLKDFERFFMEHSAIDINTLSKSNNLDEFIECLRGTDYYNILSSLYNVGTVTLFDIEMQLDLYYFTQTWKLKDKYLKGRNRETVTYTFGSRIDMLNILWIYRAKVNYSINKDTIFAYIIPIRYKLKKQQIKNMVEAKGIDEFLEAIKSTTYASFLLNLSKESAEDTYNNILSKLHVKSKMQYSMSIAPVRYFMYCKKQEISNITRIIEGIRYSLKPEEIMKYIDIYNRMEVQ